LSPITPLPPITTLGQNVPLGLRQMDIRFS